MLSQADDSAAVNPSDEPLTSTGHGVAASQFVPVHRWRCSRLIFNFKIIENFKSINFDCLQLVDVFVVEINLKYRYIRVCHVTTVKQWNNLPK